ncbi:MAG: type I methionyl aminopeptidase [Flavobacteriaceae bacterium]
MSAVVLKSPEEIALIAESAQLVSKTLGMLAKEDVPGADPLALDKLAETFIRDHKGEPGFLGMYDFPNTLNWSPNEQVVHGIPDHTPLKEGDVISIDCGVFMNGYYGDHAYTFEVGEVDPDTKKLLKTAKESLYVGISEFKAGNRVGDVGYAIQQYNEALGYGVVRELVGHGLGKSLHEGPEMPNYGRRSQGKVFKEGLVVAIEPMINRGTHRIVQGKDGWTIKTADKKPSAHFEHNVAIVDGKPKLLSTFQYIYEALGISSDEEQPFK